MAEKEAGPDVFLEEEFYEEVIAEEEVGIGQEVVEEQYIEAGPVHDESEVGVGVALTSRSINLLSRGGGAGEGGESGMDLVGPGTQSMERSIIMQQTAAPAPMEDQITVDPYPKPKHERCRCEARLYIHYHCALCQKPFALGCMLRHFQHLHYPPGTLKTVYAHLIDVEREVYGVVSYSQSTPSPAHVVRQPAGSKRCSNSSCRARRREGASEDCEHSCAIDEGNHSLPEPVFIAQEVLDNCHKDFMESYKQYLASADQNGVPAVCVLRAPPHLTSHIIYSCYNENNPMKRYLVVQCEPQISCSCGVGAEKACWHRAIVSLCCQVPGQSENEALDPPFQTLFTIREMNRFIDSSAIDTTGNAAGGTGTPRGDKGRSEIRSGRKNKVARLAPAMGATATPMAPSIQSQTANLIGRDSSELEHAQLLSELGGGGAVSYPPMPIMASSGAGPAVTGFSSVMPPDPNMLQSGILMDSAGQPELLMAINKLTETIDTLRSEVTSLKSQLADGSQSGIISSSSNVEKLISSSWSADKSPSGSLSTKKPSPLEKKQVKLLTSTNRNLFTKTAIVKVPLAKKLITTSFNGQSLAGKSLDDNENGTSEGFDSQGEEMGSGGLRPKRQIQPNRLYSGKEYLVSNSADNIYNRSSPSIQKSLPKSKP